MKKPVAGEPRALKEAVTVLPCKSDHCEVRIADLALFRKGKNMSHYMTALAMKQIGLKPATKIVLYWLADHHNETTGDCFPSIKRLVDLCEMDRATVIRHINNLEEIGIVKRVERKRDNGSQTSNAYQLMMKNATPPIANCDPTPIQNCDPHNLVINNLGNIINNTSSKDDDFEFRFNLLYNDYPRKIGKGAARKALKAALKKTDYENLFSKVIDFSIAMEGKDPKYIPHMATWLNQERWEDEQ